MNLIKRLADLKYSRNKSKITKRALTIALSGALSISLLAGAVACAPENNNNVTPPNGEITNPIKPGEETGYSKILTDVLNSSYYNGLLDEFHAGTSKGSNYLAPVPYHFLSEQGFNVENIKNSSYDLVSSSYISNNKNELVVITSLTQTNNNNAYKTIYQLKYNLTNQEYKDFIMLSEGDYIQSTFFIQELDNHKTPTVISEFKINKETYNKMVSKLNEKEEIKNAFTSKVIVDFAPISAKQDAEDNRVYYLTMNAISTETEYNDNSISNREMAKVEIRLPWSTGTSYNDNILDVFSMAFKITNTVTPTEITYFAPNTSKIYRNEFSL